MKIAHPNAAIRWHSRGDTSSLAEWWAHLKYVYGSTGSKPDCIITCFPQLALVAAMLLPLMSSPRPHLIAWTFNLGSLPTGLKRQIAATVLRRVDLFIVHARDEIEPYAACLNIQEHKLR